MITPEFIAHAAITAIVGATMFRLRGSSVFEKITTRGATTARLVYSLVLGLQAWAFWAHPITALALAAGLYIGSVDGWKRSLSLGRFVDDRPVFGAVMRHAARGLMFTFPAAFAVGAASYYTGEAVSARVLGIAFTGLWCVPLYELGWRMFPIKNAEKNAIGATEAGELLFGAFIGQATGIPYR